MDFAVVYRRTRIKESTMAMQISRYRAALALAVVGFQALALASDAQAPGTVTPDGARYYGPLVDGLMQGRGEVRYQDGRSYRGELARGQFHGTGRFEHATGDVYEGEFRNGDFTGRGTYVAKGGARYEGEFKSWRFHGKGRYVDPQGNTYEGSFVEGALDGPGKLTAGGASYEGGFKQWSYHGRGVFRQANGDVYEGQFERGLYHGEGTLTYAKPREGGQTKETGTWRYGRRYDAEEEKKRLAAVEAAVYEQKALLDKALSALKAGEPGRIDMYVLAVAGDGSQEVFRREVDFVRKAFAERFGTDGRSVALVNSRTTLASAPMATVTSIRAALQGIAARMNRDEDILFLFLTSHGSSDHELVLSQHGMQLRSLPAAELGRLLKESGIRWKVVLVSACYSGGFIDPLKDERTLVITAARRDRRSFGCADENDFTYFGRAFFKEALPGAQSFGEAFARAATLVEEWEKQDVARVVQAADSRAKAGEHHSLPQIHSPKAIEAHLQRWWAGNPAR
ncbi:MAG: C13 family peptidase [Betaproteobacteria bacterium]